MRLNLQSETGSLAFVLISIASRVDNADLIGWFVFSALRTLPGVTSHLGAPRK
jgi:hypothetical protein